ncbi:uncharacterized protein BDR25DRAFT_297831 [Lindgomyces ingoldianus]|uniref:Uncharacterized protein n=1 Tax=Lindgomyces ingoldianus TaxID=673940 RepID=A0ACB6Q9T6_9PLEO|nr:uncharacterized protein BDR25DRAFT_297831 [Lindgomyces ingoldianus]KAF2463674.1 hypothetical protein BDR25DRAFT_297831 [Lindgomyces ingoldianus]
MPPCLSSSNSTSPLNRVEAWLWNSPPASSSPIDRLRKRNCDADMSRNLSPKRQRVDIDDVLPAQSASQVGSISVVDLSDRTTLTAPQGSKRSSSPTRHLTELRTATPSITLSPFNQVKQPPPVDVAARINRLRSHLGCRKGLETCYIPAGLRQAIETDVLFVPSLAMDPIDPDAYDYEDTRQASDPSLVDMLDRVKTIFQDACHCTEFGRDENAWCYRVVWPLIELAMKLYGGAKFKLESVQSQNIQSRYLSTIPEPTPASPNRRVAFTRKTDFCFSEYASCIAHNRQLHPAPGTFLRNRGQTRKRRSQGSRAADNYLDGSKLAEEDGAGAPGLPCIRRATRTRQCGRQRN